VNGRYDPAERSSGGSAGFLEDEKVALTAILGANPFVGLTVGQRAQSISRWSAALAKRPVWVMSESCRWGAAEWRVLAGASGVTADAKDRRFADSAWQHPVWRRVATHRLLFNGAECRPRRVFPACGTSSCSDRTRRGRRCRTLWPTRI
jgi:hypothetical protein